MSGDQVDEPKVIVIGGAGYAGLHVAQRLGTRLRPRHGAIINLVDRNDYHQLLTELPRVASGTRSEQDVRVDLEGVLPSSVTFTRAEISGFDLPHRRILTDSGPLEYWRLVLALGSKPNDFQIPGLADNLSFMWSTTDAVHIRKQVDASIKQAGQSTDPEAQRRLMTVVIGGGGATGVELAAALAEELPDLARRHHAPESLAHVVLVEAGHTILAGSSQALIAKAYAILDQLQVEVLTNSVIAEAGTDGVRLKNGRLLKGGVYVWAGGVKAPDLVRGSGLEIGYNGRIKVGRDLRALGHPAIYVAGDLASVPDPSTGMAVPPLAQVALTEAETVAENLRAELEGRVLEPFRYREKGFVVSLGTHRGVADVAGLTFGGRLAHVLKDAIEWEYRESVKHLKGWAAA